MTIWALFRAFATKMQRLDEGFDIRKARLRF